MAGDQMGNASFSNLGEMILYQETATGTPLQIPQVSAPHVEIGRYSSSLIPSVRFLTGVKAALGSDLLSMCAHVESREGRGGGRTVDVTLGYDLNTCLLRLSCDQSSLRRAPHPASNFTHPSLFSFCSSSSLPVTLSLLNLSSLSLRPSFMRHHSIPFRDHCAVCYSHTPPSVLLTRPSCSLLSLSPPPCLRISREGIRGVD